MNTPDDLDHVPDALVHGMLNDLVSADWPAFTDSEVAAVLTHYVDEPTLPVRPLVTWRSPRPMSAAVLAGDQRRSVFVKRHHRRVRSRERLEIEHAFVGHLRSRGVATPRVLVATGGGTVVERGEFVYEVHATAAGHDLYRDVPSWHPFLHPSHARSAGAALARFHRAAADFPAAGWGFGVLVDSAAVLLADDPADEYQRLVTARPGLRDATAPYDVGGDFESVLRAPLEAAAIRARALATQWTHGDWHASNLTWSDPSPEANVANVFDLGLANRTFALHDLAVAIERNVIDWLDVANAGSPTVDYDSLDQLLVGYGELCALSSEDLATLSVTLPVAHVEFALSEVEYFSDVVGSPQNVELAYRSYLLGHAQWFASSSGAALLDYVGRGAPFER